VRYAPLAPSRVHRKEFFLKVATAETKHDDFVLEQREILLTTNRQECDPCKPRPSSLAPSF